MNWTVVVTAAIICVAIVAVCFIDAWGKKK